MAAGISHIPENPLEFPGIPGSRAELAEWKNNVELEPDPRGIAVPFSLELELELIQTQMTQKPMLWAEMFSHTMRASQSMDTFSGVLNSHE